MQARLREREIDAQVDEDLEEDKGAAKEKEEAQGLAGLLSANATLAAWLVFVGFGGLFLTFYYAQIEYFPELEWEQSFTYLAAISLIGGGITTLYGLLLLIPGFLWSELLIHDTVLRQRFCYSGLHGTEPCFQSLLLYIVFPFSILMAAVHLAALVPGPWVILATAVVSLLALCRYSYRQFKTVLKSLLQDSSDPRLNALIKERKDSLLLKYTAAAGVAALVGVTSLLIIYAITSSGDENKWLLLVCTLAVVISNFLVAFQFRHKPVRAVVTGLLAALVLLTAGELLASRQAAFSVRVMDQFGIGGTDSVTLVVSKAGRELFEANGVKHDRLVGNENAVIEDARILSRLGDEYFIQVQQRRVAIPKSMVLSWSKIGPKGET